MKGKIKNLILRKVDSSKNSILYYEVLRTCYNLLSRFLIRLKSIFKVLKINKPPVTNIYHASVQKTASMWIEDVFSDKRIRQATGLDVFPSHRYEYGEFFKSFPRYTFVPGLYIHYLLYKEIKKPVNYKTFYVIRDPRNIIVSWYYSMLESHRLANKQVQAHRSKLQSLNKEDGLNYCINTFHLKLSFMRSWVYHAHEDDNVILVKFEDLTNFPIKEFERIFEHCNVTVAKNDLKKVLVNHSKDRMRRRDLKTRSNTKSNYSKKGSNWEDELTVNNLKLFNKINGDLVDILGYKHK